MTTVEDNSKLLFLGDIKEYNVITTGVSTKDPYGFENIKHDESQMTERQKKGALKITVQVEGEKAIPIWITKFNKIDRQAGIELKFKRGFF